MATAHKEPHPTFARLLWGALQVQLVTKEQFDDAMQRGGSRAGGATAIARALNESPQSVNNWIGRGVSKAGALKAQGLLGISPAWILDGLGQPLVSAADPTDVAIAETLGLSSPPQAADASLPWPFTEIDRGKLCGLRGDQAMRMQFAMLGAAASLGVDIAIAPTGKGSGRASSIAARLPQHLGAPIQEDFHDEKKQNRQRRR